MSSQELLKKIAAADAEIARLQQQKAQLFHNLSMKELENEIAKSEELTRALKLALEQKKHPPPTLAQVGEQLREQFG